MVYTAYIVDAVRTAGGRKNGVLSGLHPADLGASVLDSLVERNNFDGALIDDVVVGCVTQIATQAGNVGRNMVLASKHIPISVPATSVDRQCGSGQQALHFAVQAVMSGTQDVVVAAGVESMSQVPIGANISDPLKYKGRGIPWAADGIQEKYPGVMFSQFEGAELLAQKYKLTREELDQFGYDSQRKAHAATQAGYFKNEIVPVTGENKKGEAVVHTVDEGIRPSVSLEQMSKLKPMKKDGGVLTPATASQICDGAAAILVCNEAGLKKLGVKPRAKIVALALAGSDPVIMLEGPIPATQNVLKRSGLSIDDMDLYEVNEAFASVPVAWRKAVGADFAKLNVNGGACALGHPLGGTGVKLFATLLNELERRKKRYGLVAICEGGGTANATIIEAVSEADAPSSRL